VLMVKRSLSHFNVQIRRSLPSAITERAGLISPLTAGRISSEIDRDLTLLRIRSLSFDASICNASYVGSTRAGIYLLEQDGSGIRARIGTNRGSQ